MSPTCIHYDIFLQNITLSKTTIYSCAWTNIVLVFPTTVFNLLLIIVLATSRDKTQPCTVLLLNLAITDLIAGLVHMPLYYIIFRYKAEDKDPCDYAKFVIPFSLAVSAASFAIVTLIAMERYTKIFHPFYYLSKLSLRNVAVCIALSWAMSFIALPPLFAGIYSVVINGLIGTSIIIVVSLNLFCYLRILLRARKVNMQIRNEATRFGQATINSTSRRYIYIGGLIIVSMVICFSPMVVDKFSQVFGGKKDSDTKNKYGNFVCWKWTLILLNSFINPVITFSFCPDVRRSVLKILTFRALCKYAER